MISPVEVVSPVQLTTAAATYYTVPDKTVTMLTRLTLTNTTASDQTVTIYFIPRGSTAGAGNALAYTMNVPAASGQPPVDVTAAAGHALKQSSYIQALCSAGASVTMRISGIEFET